MGTLATGDSMTGLVLDDVADTPWVAATISYKNPGGVVVEIPFVDSNEAPQFSVADAWFRGDGQPPNLKIFTPSGTYSLIGCDYSQSVGRESNGLRIGRVRPQLVVCSSREGELHRQLRVKDVRSVLEGLHETTSATSFEVETTSGGASLGKQITIDFPDFEPITWRQGDAQLAVLPSHAWQSGHRAFDIRDQIYLTSTFDGPATFDRHIAEQRKVSRLLTLLHGAPAYFRQHDVRDEEFPETYQDGRIAYVPYQAAISRETYREFQQPEAEKYRYKFPLSSLESIGAEGLEAWASVHETWSRAIEPLVALFRRRTVVEDALISTCISLEAAGQLLGAVDGEEATYSQRNKPTTATYLYRAIMQVPAEWSQCAQSVQGIARAGANLYNDIKHFDRRSTPDPAHLAYTAQLLMLTARIVILGQIDRGDGLLKKASRGMELRNVLRTFADKNIYISDSGTFADGQVHNGEQS